MHVWLCQERYRTMFNLYKPLVVWGWIAIKVSAYKQQSTNYIDHPYISRTYIHCKCLPCCLFSFTCVSPFVPLYRSSRVPAKWWHHRSCCSIVVHNTQQQTKFFKKEVVSIIYILSCISLLPVNNTVVTWSTSCYHMMKSYIHQRDQDVSKIYHTCSPFRHFCL